MYWIRFPAALLPSLVFFHFLDQGAQAVLGAPLPRIVQQTWTTGSADTLLALAVVAVLTAVFLAILSLMFGDWAVLATTRHGGLRRCMFLGETYSGTRYYLNDSRTRDAAVSQDAVLTIETNSGAAPRAQSFRNIFRFHLLDEEGSRLGGRETGMQRAMEQLIISPVTLWLIFIFAGLAFLPSLVFEVLQPPGNGMAGLPVVLEPPYSDSVLLPAMPELAQAFTLTVMIGGAALWRRYRLANRFQETAPNPDPKPRVQSGDILEGRIVERASIDPGWYHSPQIGYSLKIENRFKAPVIIGFSLASGPDCPLFRSLEYAIAKNAPVRVWVDPDAKVRPFLEPLPAPIQYEAPKDSGKPGADVPGQRASMMPNS